MTRNVGCWLLTIALLCGAALMPACRRSEKKSAAVKATDPKPSLAKEGSSPESEPADTDVPQSDDSEAAGKQVGETGPSSGETGDTMLDYDTGEESEDATFTESEPTPATESKLPDPNPTPIDGLEMEVTKSGLKYWDIRKGEGEIPDPNAWVTVYWRAWFPDGRLFDDSASKGLSPVYGRMGVVKGFYEGVWSMRVGGIRRLEVPPELGWGEKGKPPAIPPNTTMVIEVELLDTKSRRHHEPFEHLQAVTSPTGLKYWDFKVGDGARPTLRSTAEMHYAMWLDDGTLIADTVETKIPPKIRTDALPAGWRVGVSTMQVGGRRRLEIPVELGYGTEGEPYVPPNVGLVMEVELLGVEPPEPWPPPTPVEGIEPVTTPAGLTYWDLEEGYGRSPHRAGTILAHLTGWLSDGTMYESSLEGEKQVAIRLSEEIAGLAHGIRTLKVGGKRQLKVPPELAYGKKGRPGIVPPNETLIIEVELFGFTE